MLKFEYVGLVLGSVAAAVMLAAVRLGDVLGPAALELFRGGEPGALVVGLCMLLGLLAMWAFPINLIRGKREWWGARLLLVLVFLVLCGAMGASF
jgi:hypothetical protein